VHRVIQQAFSIDGADPETIARFLIERLNHRPNGAVEKTALERFALGERRLVQLLHFTHLANVPSIYRFGIVPRAHLMAEPVKIVLTPIFADDKRLDGHQEKNCLSMSYPNYRMFARKRWDIGGDWAVLKIDPYVIVDRYCEFSPSNAARSDIAPRGGVEGAQLLFCNWRLRNELGLERSDPTDPQAEILEDSVIEPRYIMAIAVETEAARDRLSKSNIECNVEPDLFRARADYRYWQQNRLPVPKNDYSEVLAYERARDALASS
jgi:hypothetical protein